MVITRPQLVDVEENSWENNASPVPTSSFNSNCNSDPNSTQHASQARVLCQLQRAEAWLDEKMGIETQGIDRILEENKQPPSLLNMFLLWWSLTCHVGSLPIGMIGSELGLSFAQSVMAITTGTMFGAICTAFCGSLGPKVRTFFLEKPLRLPHVPQLISLVVLSLIPHKVARMSEYL